MKKPIPYGKQSISKEDIEAVTQVLNSDFITQGPEVPKFEQSITQYSGADFAVALNSATSALHVACMSLGIQSGDIVWTSPLSFVASANCVIYCGGEIDFVDVDLDTNNICIKSLKSKLIESRKNGTLPKAIIAVHLAGLSRNMKDLHELSNEFNFKIIEDASHAIGGDYNESKIGSCEFSDIAIFSFHPVKIITSGEGGILVTNQEDIYLNACKLRSHGITRNPKELNNASFPQWYYEQHLLGFNYRMTDFQAALGNSQLKEINNFIKQRRKICMRYLNLLDSDDLDMPSSKDISISSNHLFIIKIKNKSKNRDRLYDILRDKQIFTNLHYIPIYRQPYYIKRYNFNFNDFANSEIYFKNALSIPVYPALSSEEQDEVIKEITCFLQS